MSLTRTTRRLAAATALTLALGAGYALAGAQTATDGIVHIDNAVPSTNFDPGGTVAAPQAPAAPAEAPAAGEAPQTNGAKLLGRAAEGKAAPKPKAPAEEKAPKAEAPAEQAPDAAPAEEKAPKAKDEC